MAENRLYFASEEGKISVVRPGRDWELIQLNDIGDPFYATPALSSGRIFARGSEALSASEPNPSRVGQASAKPTRGESSHGSETWGVRAVVFRGE